MDSARYHKVQIGNHALQPETLMLGYGYDPALSEGSAKPPVFLTSTFVFRTAEEGRDFFDYTAGRREPPAEGRSGLVYSRFNHPNLEIVEDRHDKGSLIITSQVPVERWHDLIGVPTLADAILDRVVHNAYRVELAGDSLRKRRSQS